MNEHLNADALRAFVRASNAQKQAIAVACDETPSSFANLVSGLRFGTDPDQRERIAAGLSTIYGFEIHVRAITCFCDEPTVHREGRQ